MYRLLRARLPGTTLFSIGHRPTLKRFHERRLQFRSAGAGPARLEAVAAAP